MATDHFQGVERRRFPTLMAIGVAFAAVLVAAAFAADPEYGWPLVVLLAICAVAAVGFRLIAAAGRDDADHEDSVPRQPLTDDRPLGDTPEAHDEISPHDVPVGSPERKATEDAAGGAEGTTRG